MNFHKNKKTVKRRVNNVAWRFNSPVNQENKSVR